MDNCILTFSLNNIYKCISDYFGYKMGKDQIFMVGIFSAIAIPYIYIKKCSLCIVVFSLLLAETAIPALHSNYLHMHGRFTENSACMCFSVTS